QHPFHHIEKLIFAIVLVPVKFAVENAKPNDRFVDPSERLVEPLLLTVGGQLFHINQLESFKLDVGMNRILRWGCHRVDLTSLVPRVPSRARFASPLLEMELVAGVALRRHFFESAAGVSKTSLRRGRRGL